MKLWVNNWMTEKEKVKNFTDALTQNIINTPDDEILKEVKQEHGDVEFEANIMRNIINNVRKNNP